MAVEVTLIPSDHKFMVEPGETILEAGLRSGLSLRYHCSNGTCGECLGRIVSGEVAEIQHHDYVLSEAQKASGQVLLCRTIPATDMTIEASEDDAPEAIPIQEIETRVSRLEQVNDDTLVVHLRTPRSQTLRFLAGQHANLTLPDGQSRTKTIASCPCNGMILQFHVRQRPDDSFADYVHRTLKLRDNIHVRGPCGRVTLDEDSRRPVLFIACETGFSMMKSLIEHAISLELSQPMHLFWITCLPEGQYMANYCRAWSDALDNFTYTPVIAAPPGSDAAACAGTADNGNPLPTALDAVFQRYPDLSAHDIYLNGPPELLAGCRAHFIEHGARPDRMFTDDIRQYQAC